MRAVGRKRSGADPLDDLYAVPLRDFIAHRKAIATRLRGQGKVAEARRVAAVQKPKATVWAINRVARTSPQAVQRLVTAFDRVRTAQLRQPAELAEAAAALRNAVEPVVHQAVDAMKGAGLATTLDTHRRLGNTLRGAAATARGALIEGRLTEEVTPSGFEVFGDAMPRGRRLRAVPSTPAPAPVTAAPSPPKRAARDEHAQRRAAQLEAEAGSRAWDAAQASEAVRKAQEQLRRAQRTARDAARAAAKSRRLAERARGA